MRVYCRRSLILLVLLYSCASYAASSSVDYAGVIDSIYQKVKDNKSGHVADYIPALKKANPEHCGIVLATVDGEVYKVGDCDVEFAIESISKVFTLALALQDVGAEEILKNVGAYQTGLPFNSILAPDIRQIPLQNPLVNAGAIMTTSFIDGNDSNDKWERALTFLSEFAARKLRVMKDVCDSEMATNQHNKALAWQAKSSGFLQGSPEDAVIRYTKACSIGITCEDLAKMGATLANSGKNPFTEKRLMPVQHVELTLSMMMISGMYDSSGPWLLKVGLPGKSGVGGGVLAVVPGKMAFAVFSPPLDKFGNSARGVEATELFSGNLGLHLLKTK